MAFVQNLAGWCLRFESPPAAHASVLTEIHQHFLNELDAPESRRATVRVGTLALFVADVAGITEENGVFADVNREIADAFERAGDKNKVEQDLGATAGAFMNMFVWESVYFP